MKRGPHVQLLIYSTEDPRKGEPLVLSLTGLELIFFVVAFMGIQFGFVLKTVFITQF